MRTFKTNTAIAKILIHIKHMDRSRYIQEISYGPEGRVFIGVTKYQGRSISIRNVEILACGVMFLPD